MANVTRESLLLIGAGGHAKVVVDALIESGRYEVVGLLDADPARHGHAVLGYRVLGDEGLLDEEAYAPCAVVIAIGDNALRLDAAARCVSKGRQFARVLHSSALIAREVELGEGTVVLAGAVINPGTSIGAHCIVNTSASIDHDCVLADGAHVSPGVHIAGGARIGRAAHIGIGASILPGVCIGENAVIGAGAAVVNDVSDGAVVVGVPAKPV